MQGCFTWLLALVGGVFVMVTLLRWFEQTAEAVRYRWWNKALLLVAFPFAVWFFRSRISAGRATPVPLHEPVRGFGLPAPGRAPAPDEPPPGTPRKFLGMPVVPPKAVRRPGAGPDADKIARLRQKMREQGMLGDDRPPDAPA